MNEHVSVLAALINFDAFIREGFTVFLCQRHLDGVCGALMVFGATGSVADPGWQYRI